MSIDTRLVDYTDQGQSLQGFFACDSSTSASRPAVLIVHQWDGRSEFVGERARQLAAEGYAAFALDMYGKGILGKSVEENMKLMNPFMEDRRLIVQRVQAAVTTVCSLPEVDSTRIAVIGYCFGGLCALDFARSGADIRGVASFHGLLKGSGLPKKQIKAKILVQHGADDPMAPPDDVLAFQKEMNEADADWQIHIHGHAKHAFAVPGANNSELGLQYNVDANRRSWRCTVAFLSEILGQA